MLTAYAAGTAELGLGSAAVGLTVSISWQPVLSSIRQAAGSTISSDSNFTLNTRYAAAQMPSQLPSFAIAAGESGQGHKGNNCHLSQYRHIKQLPSCQRQQVTARSAPKFTLTAPACSTLISIWQIVDSTENIPTVVDLFNQL